MHRAKLGRHGVARRPLPVLVPVPEPVPEPVHKDTFAPPCIVREPRVLAEVLLPAPAPAPVQGGNFALPGVVEPASVAQRRLGGLVVLAVVPVRLAAAAAPAPAVVAERRCIRFAAGAGFDRPA